MRFVTRIIFVCAVALALTPAAAFARPDVVLHLSGATVQKTASGEKLTPLDPNVKLKAGEIVRWTLVASNKGSDPALHLMPSDKIPAGTAYIAGTASAVGGSAQFSTDDGKTWSSKPMTIVQTPTGPVTKPADPSSYTNIRWIADKPLAPKGSVRFQYEVRVK
jgi:uncharacterized repeat protein (TIGR01451 family)